MKNKNLLVITTALLCTCLISSCGDDIPENPTPKNTSLIIGDQFNYGIDSILLFPVGCSYNPEVSGKRISSNYKSSLSFRKNTSNLYDQNANKEFVNSNEKDFDIRNILFYDLESTKSFPLTADTLHILSFGVHYEFENDLIFYRVVKRDYNEDDVFDSKDAVALYTSDLYGKNFTQITPFAEKFVSYTYYAKSSSLLLKTIIDNNQDKEYTSTDETNFRTVSLDNLKMADNIFSKEIKDQLREQMKN